MLNPVKLSMEKYARDPLHKNIPAYHTRKSSRFTKAY